MKRISTLLMLTIMSIMYVSAQDLTFTDIKLLADDNTATESPCYDNNGELCALLKIKTPNLEGLDFHNKKNYKGTVTYNNGIYYAYIPKGLTKLEYKHKDFLAGEIVYDSLGMKTLEKGKTYMIELILPESPSFVVFKVTPSDATITFNGEIYSGNENGMYEIPALPDTYRYKIEAENHKPTQGMVQIRDSEKKSISLALRPIMHRVQINCTPKDATIFIDNIDYGQSGSKEIPQGKHHIRISKNKYIDHEAEIVIDANTTHLEYKLVENENIDIVHATPVTIYATSKYIYKDNKRIKEWKNGTAVKFMPGTYMLSDDDGNMFKLKVGRKPFTVRIVGDTMQTE